MISPWTWEQLFPDAEYGFHFQFKRESLHAYYGRRTPRPVLEQRAGLIERHADWFVAFDAQSDTFVKETAALLASTGLALNGDDVAPRKLLHRMGMATDADLVVLRPDAGAWRVTAGVVCFPSGWSLPEKLGKTLEDIHGVVPGLNAALSERINKFISGLKPGYSWERVNWGLSAADQLSMHPNLQPSRLQSDTPVNQVWVRVEMQSLALLPETGGLLFGIRILNQPLITLLEDASLKVRIERALRTMPDDVAEYKGLAAFRETFLRRG